MLKSWLTLAIAGVLVFTITPAKAGVVYDNGVPDYKQAFISDNQNYHSNRYIILTYDDFSLRSGSTIWDIHWWGAYDSNSAPAVDSFRYEIRTNQGSAGPSDDAIIASGSLSGVVRTDTGHNLSELGATADVYKFDAVTSGITLAAGAYYLSIYDTVANPGNAFAWATVNFGAGTGNAWGYISDRNTGESIWHQEAPVYISDVAFNLTNDPPATVPEPATMLLLGSGLVGLAGYGRKKIFGKQTNIRS